MVLEGPGLGEGGGLEPHGASWLEIGAHGDPAGKLRKGLFLGELEPSSSVGPPGCHLVSPSVPSGLRGWGRTPPITPSVPATPARFALSPWGGTPK